MGIAILLTGKKDPTSDYIEKAFKENRKEIFRVNIDINEIPKFHFNPFDSHNGWIEDINSNRIKKDQIKLIIFRRPQLPNIISDDEIKNRFYNREVLHGIRAFFESTDALWMNHPDANSFASSKPRNLRIAKDFGLKVPETLISSDIKELLSWISKRDSYIMKSISHGLLEGENFAKMAFTQKLSKDFDIENNIESGIPILLQEEIKKKADVRITVVGDMVFSACLLTTDNIIDWRQNNDLKWSKLKIPNEIAKACVNICKYLKLNFAAIDFVIDAENNYVFLEINPNGQWVWIEKDTNLPISKSIMDFVKGVEDG